MGVREFQDLVRAEREAKGHSREMVATLAANFEPDVVLDASAVWRVEIVHQRIDPGEVRAVSRALGLTNDAVLRALDLVW